MYTAKPGTNVVWNVLPYSSLAYKTRWITVIGQLHFNNSAVGTCMQDFFARARTRPKG